MIFERVREIICSQLDLDEDRVTMDSNILEDFDADSLDLVDLVMSFEDEFGIEVPDDQTENFHTVGDILKITPDFRTFSPRILGAFAFILPLLRRVSEENT